MLLPLLHARTTHCIVWIIGAPLEAWPERAARALIEVARTFTNVVAVRKLDNIRTIVRRAI